MWTHRVLRRFAAHPSDRLASAFSESPVAAGYAGAIRGRNAEWRSKPPESPAPPDVDEWAFCEQVRSFDTWLAARGIDYLDLGESAEVDRLRAEWLARKGGEVDRLRSGWFG